jgi:hypothetical protein
VWDIGPFSPTVLDFVRQARRMQESTSMIGLNTAEFPFCPRLLNSDDDRPQGTPIWHRGTWLTAQTFCTLHSRILALQSILQTATHKTCHTESQRLIPGTWSTTDQRPVKTARCSSYSFGRHGLLSCNFDRVWQVSYQKHIPLNPYLFFFHEKYVISLETYMEYHSRYSD